MDSKEFKKAIALLVKEKGISEDVIYECIKQIWNSRIIKRISN